MYHLHIPRNIVVAVEPCRVVARADVEANRAEIATFRREQFTQKSLPLFRGHVRENPRGGIGQRRAKRKKLVHLLRRIDVKRLDGRIGMDRKTGRRDFAEVLCLRRLEEPQFFAPFRSDECRCQHNGRNYHFSHLFQSS